MDTQHHETPSTDDDDDFEELLPDLYVEKASSMLFEVKFFNDFILVRPATPAFYTAIRKISVVEFSRLFDEFYGDKEAAREFMRQAPAEFYVETI